MKVAVTVLALIAVALLAFGGLTMWKQQQVAGSDAAVDAFQQTADEREMVDVTFVVTAPDTTPDDQDVYISGSHPALGSWEAAGLPLERQDDGTYRGTVEMLSGIEREFKITRGSWSTVERSADDAEVDNRPFTAQAGQEVAVAVEAWVDRGETVPGRNTALPGVRLHERRFFSTVDSSKPRSLAVYLPPGYGESEGKRYPVLYVHDGQNLFNEATTFAGVEWGLDEAAQKLIESGSAAPFIIVGVYNTEDRDVEYGAGVAAYADHFVETLKPFVDETYLTLPDRDDTAIAGAALGGRAALEVARLKPDAFGTVVALSPFVVDAEGNDIASNWQAAAEATAAWAQRTRFYLDTAASAEHYATQTPTEDLMAIVGWLNENDADVSHHVVEDGEHREASWGRRAAKAIQWLHGQTAVASETAARLLRNNLFEASNTEATWHRWMKNPDLAPRSEQQTRLAMIFGGC